MELSNTISSALENKVYSVIDLYHECIERPFTSYYEITAGYYIVTIINDVMYLIEIFKKLVNIRLPIRDIFEDFFNTEIRLKLISRYEEFALRHKLEYPFLIRFPLKICLNRFTYKLPIMIKYLMISELENKNKKFTEKYYQLLRKDNNTVLNKYFFN